MRPVAIVALLLASLAGLAFVPASAAVPPAPDCNGTVGGGPTVGPVSVFVSPPCYVVSVDPGMGCPVSTSSWHPIVSAQGIVVRVKACDPPADAADSSSAQAQPCTCPPPQCAPISTVGPVAGVVSVSVSGTCNVRVDLLTAVACASPLDERTSVTQGRVTATAPCEPKVDPCEPPLDCYPEASAVGTTFWLPVCIERELLVGPVGAGFDQCRGDHETFPCFSPQRIHHYEQVGPVWVQVHVCFPHSPPPTLGASAAAIEPPVPPVCGPDMLCQGPECPSESVASEVDHHNSVTVNADCTVDIVTGYGQICVGAWTGHDTYVVGPVTWDRYYCRPPGGGPVLDLTAGSAAAAPPRPCGAADPTQRCPAPVPLCSGVQDFPPLVDVSYNCHVTVDTTALVACVFGHDESRTVGPLTVKYTVCEGPCGAATCPPPAATSAMADPFPTCVRECSPIPNGGCELQAATPTTVGPTMLPFNPQQAVWGGDCDIDVEPIGACAPPSGTTKEFRALFLHVTLLLCGGSPPPVWS